MADFLISHIWQNGDGAITHVLLHRLVNNEVRRGMKIPEREISAILPGNRIRTIEWDYGTGSWLVGAEVSVTIHDNRLHLLTHHNGKTTGTLSNLPQLNY